jgi:predicted nucleic acid-binding protein
MRVFPLTEDAALEGCRAVADYQLSIGNGLIWAVAKLNAIPVASSEDMQGRESIDNVRYVNPFSPDVDSAAL